jgi:TetR/AcrR family transcriptional regulator
MTATAEPKGRPPKPTRLGRPPRGQDQEVRSALLSAARGLFAQRGYEAISIRAVALATGVNPAMIHYYFGSKQGLYEAMLADAFAPLVERVDALLAAADEPAALGRFLDLYMRTLGENPWMPSLMLREVAAENGSLRSWFLQQFASRGGGVLARLIQREQSAGRLRADADPTLTALSLVSLAVFPFVALPAGGDASGMRVRADYLERLIAHTEEMFRRGVAA